MDARRALRRLLLLVCPAVLLSGCLFEHDRLPDLPGKAGPTPTISTAFSAEQAALVPTPTLVITPTPPGVNFTPRAIPTPQPTLGAEAKTPCFRRVGLPPATEDPSIAAITREHRPERPTTVPLSSRYAELNGQITNLAVFDTRLADGWVLEHSLGVRYTVAGNASSLDGGPMLVVRPTVDCGKFFLSLAPEATLSYPRKQFLGVRFWLSGGDGFIDPEDLTVSVVGSNAVPYWREDDASVVVAERATRDMPLFSERWLWSAEVYHDIPPDTWVELVFWFDDDWYEPEYTYITGIYIRNQYGFTMPYYIDNISLIAASGHE